MRKILAEIRDRRIWRTLVAYPSVAFVLLQAVEFFINNYGLDARFLTATMIAAVGFLPLALIWNWMHGEVGRQPFRAPEITSYVALSVVTLGAVGWYLATAEPDFRARQESLPPARSLAVLPFENPGADSAVQYLCEGIAESLINWLATLPGIRVSAKSAAFRLRGDMADPAELGRELGVDGVIRGQLKQVGGQVVVSAALIDVRDGSQLWGERLARPLEDVIFLERAIVDSITASLELEITDSDPSEAPSGGTDDPEAYRHYLQGRYLASGTTSESIDQGLEELRRAIEQDPGFALAYANIAEAVVQRFYYGLTPSPGQIDEARTAAQSAIALAPKLAEAHTALAMIRMYIDFDWAGAERAFEAAVALQPLTPVPYHRYADFLWGTLRFDRAREMAHRALAVDPVDSSSLHALGITELFAGRFEAAAEAFNSWSLYYPGIAWAHVKEGVAWALHGNCGRAMALAETARQVAKGRESALMESWLARLYYLCGDQPAFAAALERARQGSDGDPMVRYTVLQLDGDVDGLVALMQEMVDQRLMNVPFLQISRLDYLWPTEVPSVRDDPRYLAILRQLDFPPTPWAPPLVVP